MPPNDATIESGVLTSGHLYARIGTGARVVLSIPGLSSTHVPAKPASGHGFGAGSRFAEDACAFLAEGFGPS